MSDMSGGNGSMNIHILSQHDWDLNNSDVSYVHVLINSHSLSKSNGSRSFKDMDGDVEMVMQVVDIII